MERFKQFLFKFNKYSYRDCSRIKSDIKTNISRLNSLTDKDVRLSSENTEFKKKRKLKQILP